MKIKTQFLAILATLFSTQLAQAQSFGVDQGYRYISEEGFCRLLEQDPEKEYYGRNWGFWGECGGINKFTTLPSKSFEGQSLRGLYVSIVDISNLNLRGADLTGSVFVTSNLLNADFSNANLTNAYAISNPNFSGSLFISARIVNADFEATELTATNFTKADLSNSNFRSSDLSNAKLNSAIANNVDFTQATLNGADLRGAKLGNAKIDDLTELEGAIYNSATELPFSESEAKEKGMVYKP